ncbi:MAG: HAMP domain-containing sensor histidine kinase, partial [Oscillospiraceae bacterium]|nr:HAMP domain-containing sensor histidine kinase [Oscillospiraceae bacterium]
MNLYGFKLSGSGITKRWIVVSLLLTIVILVVASAAILLSTRQSYYSLARQAIDFRIRSTISQLPSSSLTAADRAAALRGLVEDFGEKEKFEFMLVDSSGSVIVTSSGFSYNSEEPMEDYFAAETSSDGEGTYIGYSASGEHIIAVTRLLSSPIGEAAAVRFVSSLRSIDAQLMSVAQTVVLVCLAIIGFVVFSGAYFIRSIVIPIGEIGTTAKQIAGGDFNARIENKYNDEIGELSEIINDMAAGLGDADRMKNEFISSISHELRTPLTSIKGWAETISQIGASDRGNFEKGMGIIISETDRLSILVEDLLDFSRLRSSSLALNCEPFDLSAELSAAVQTVEQRVKSLHLSIDLEMPAEHIVMDGDRNRIRQVFTNILDNAIKYSAPGGQIEVRADVERGVASIATTDRGAGIPEKELPLISNRFYKASNSVTGSGIG